MTLLVMVFSIVVGEIEDCVFGGLKLGSESSVDQIFEWVVHVLWRCKYFFSGWYGSNILVIWNSNRRRLEASSGRGGYSFIDAGIHIVSECISGSIGSYATKWHNVGCRCRLHRVVNLLRVVLCTSVLAAFLIRPEELPTREDLYVAVLEYTIC